MIKTENYVKEFYEIFFSQKKIIFWTTLIVFVLSILIAFFWPPTYSGTGSILVKGKKIEKSPSTLSVTYEQFYPVTKEDLVSEEQTLTSFDVVKNTLIYLKKKGLYKRSQPGLLANILGKFHTNVSERKKILSTSKEDAKLLASFPEIVEEVYKILGNLKTEVIPSSNVIKLTYYDRDPEYATLIANTIMQQYLIYRRQLNSPNQAEMFYREQAERIKDIINKKSQELLKLARTKSVSNPKREIEANIVLKADLERRLSSIKQKIIEKEKFISHLEKTLKSKKLEFYSFITADQSRVITDISGSLFAAIVERENMLEKYKPQSLKIKLLDKKITALSRSLKKEVTVYKNNQISELNALKQQMNYLQKKVSELEQRNVILNQIDQKMENIKWDLATLRKSYGTLLKREEEARINTAVNKTNLNYFVAILNKAFPSNGPVFPKKGVVIPLGLLIGFIIGCSFGFLREYFDHTFKKPSDVETYIGLPVLFSIPKSRNRMKKFLISIVFVLAFLLIFGSLSFLKHHDKKTKTSALPASISKTRKISISPSAIAWPSNLSEREETYKKDSKISIEENRSRVERTRVSSSKDILASSRKYTITCLLY